MKFYKSENIYFVLFWVFDCAKVVARRLEVKVSVFKKLLRLRYLNIYFTLGECKVPPIGGTARKRSIRTHILIFKNLLRQTKRQSHTAAA